MAMGADAGSSGTLTPRAYIDAQVMRTTCGTHALVVDVYIWLQLCP